MVLIHKQRNLKQTQRQPTPAATHNTNGTRPEDLKTQRDSKSKTDHTLKSTHTPSHRLVTGVMLTEAENEGNRC